MKVTISFDPELDEVEYVVAAVEGVYDSSGEDQPDVDVEDVDARAQPSRPQSDWTALRVRRYLPNLATEAVSLLALVACAESGTLTPTTLGGFIDRDAGQIRGVIGSLGKAATRTYGVPSRARPFMRRGGVYVMSDADRELFRTELEANYGDLVAEAQAYLKDQGLDE